ncbi:hypothetical protein [Streptomyces sp. NPDC002690]
MNATEATYTLLDEKNVPVGTGIMSVSSSMTLSQSTATISELLTVKVTRVTGKVASLNVAFDVGCTSTCSATTKTPWVGGRTILPNGQASGTVTYTSNVATGGNDSFRTSYHIYVTSAGASPLQPNINWDSPNEAPIRCDRELTAPGCVIPQQAAILRYSISDPNNGAAAAAYELVTRSC